MNLVVNLAAISPIKGTDTYIVDSTKFPTSNPKVSELLGKMGSLWLMEILELFEILDLMKLLVLLNIIEL